MDVQLAWAQRKLQAPAGTRLTLAPADGNCYYHAISAGSEKMAGQNPYGRAAADSAAASHNFLFGSGGALA